MVESINMSQNPLGASKGEGAVPHDNGFGQARSLEDCSNKDDVPQKHLAHPLLYEATTRDVLVDFDGPDDPYNPMNWPFHKKVATTMLWALTTCWIIFASAVYSAGIEDISKEFHVSNEVANSGTSLLVFGFALGPMIWAPLCEMYGRKWAALAPYFVGAVLSFGTATAKDIQTVLITRFFAGVFGSAPVTITGGALADMWAPRERGTPMVAYGLTLAGAPTLGPIIGGALCSSSLGWRWTSYLTGIVMMVQFAVDVLAMDESHPAVLLVYKARRLRHEGKNFALHAKHEETSPSFKELIVNYFVRPFQMLVDPICLLISVYAAFVYGTLYASLLSFSIEYQEYRGWGPVVGQLPFLALLVGCLIAGAANIYNNGYYVKRFRANGYRAVPEARLPPMMYGGFAFTGGLFLFGWTSSEHLSNYWPSIIGILLTGFGFTTIFQSALQYLVDTYTRYSASAIAANTFLRSMFAGSFPLFVLPMYTNLGIDWGSTIFACFSTVLLPVPFLFFRWGAKIRAKGQWSKLSTY